MIITKHAYSKAKERCGLNKKGIQSLLEKAMAKGLLHNELTGNLLKWVNSRYLICRNANNMRVYGNFLFVISNGILITVYALPSNLEKIAHRITKLKQEVAYER